MSGVRRTLRDHAAALPPAEPLISLSTHWPSLPRCLPSSPCLLLPTIYFKPASPSLSLGFNVEFKLCQTSSHLKSCLSVLKVWKHFSINTSRQDWYSDLSIITINETITEWSLYTVFYSGGALDCFKPRNKQRAPLVLSKPGWSSLRLWRWMSKMLHH